MFDTSIASFTINVTWHETAGAYSRSINGRDGARMKADLLATLNEHDAFGRMYNVTAHYSDGRRETLSGAALDALRS